MSKPQSERKHGLSIKKSHESQNKTPEQIRAEKTLRCKTRNAEKKQQRATAAANRPRRTVSDQLAYLNANSLVATKERKKITKKLANAIDE